MPTYLIHQLARFSSCSQAKEELCISQHHWWIQPSVLAWGHCPAVRRDRGRDPPKMSRKYEINILVYINEYNSEKMKYE